MSIRKQWVRLGAWILGLKFTRFGQVPEGVFLFVSNHRSFSDPVVALNYIYALPLAKAEVSKYPLIGFGAKITGVLFVQRENVKSRASAKRAINETLASEQSVLIYPEGTTTNGSTSDTFKVGSFEVAVDLGIPVVPIAIEYQDPLDHWANTGIFEHFVRQFGKGSSRCFVGFGPVLRGSDSRELMASTQGWIDEQLVQYRSEFAAK